MHRGKPRGRARALAVRRGSLRDAGTPLPAHPRAPARWRLRGRGARRLGIAGDGAMTERVRHVTAGVDEAGRGPLAGPVVCAAVILKPRFRLPGLNDSKALCEDAREHLFPMVQRNALCWQVVFVEREEID